MQLGLKQLGIDLSKTDFFITHLHADHFGLVSKLATTSSQVFFNRPERELIEASGWWERMVAYAAEMAFLKTNCKRRSDRIQGVNLPLSGYPKSVSYRMVMKSLPGITALSVFPLRVIA